MTNINQLLKKELNVELNKLIKIENFFQTLLKVF